MRTESVESCWQCKKPTNFYDPNAGRICPSCEWNFIYSFKLSLADTWINPMDKLKKEDLDDGSCTLGKNKEEWLSKEPNIKPMELMK